MMTACTAPSAEAAQAIRPVTLTGQHVQLTPLSHAQHDELVEAAVDGELWKLWYTGVPTPEGMKAEISRRLALQAAGSMVPFSVVDLRLRRIVGMTSFMNIDAISPRAEIGSTWYARAVQRTPLNTEAKRLLLAYAFNQVGCIAVELRTHVLNQQSRRAIERLGAKLDGVLRCHQRARDGTLRDTCVYSVIASEWPAVSSHLSWQLERPR